MFSGYRNWKSDTEWDTDVPYSFLADTLDKVSSESKRLLMIEYTTNAMRSILHKCPDQLFYFICLITNTIAAPYEGLELGIGDAVIIRTICDTYGKTPEKIKIDVRTTGDLGLVAAAYSGTQKTFTKPKPLTVENVYGSFRTIATLSGKDCIASKRHIIQKMLMAANRKETVYIIRALQGKMRTGMADLTILTAIAYAFVMSEPGMIFDTKISKKLEKAVAHVRQAFCELPDYGKLCQNLIEGGTHNLDRCFLTVGIPVKPMLAKPTNGIKEVLDRMQSTGEFTCDYKYDGERAQIHMFSDGTVKVFSRNMEDMTSKYPDIASTMEEVNPEHKTVIIDCEAVAVDSNGEILPFQILSTRKRKDATTDNIKVQVCVFAFDLLYYDDQSLIKKNLYERRNLLHTSFTPLKCKFEYAKSADPKNEDEISDMLNDAILAKTEGLMVKSLYKNASYEPSKRSLSWLKLKKDYLQGLCDTVDTIVIGGYYGKGKRTGTFGAYLVSCYSPEHDEYQTLCKVGTGFSDEDLIQLSDKCNKLIVDEKPENYDVNMHPGNVPDVWFSPSIIFEIKGADLSISPVHTAGTGLVHQTNGIALRFPRFLRVRSDKCVSDISTDKDIHGLYVSQANVA